MKLEFIAINRFRSIENVELANCGEFNVLIGRNNAGKSNILSAISIFFTCIKGGHFATLNPIKARDINFFDRDSQYPIEITLVFSLTLPERDELVRDIVTESPQMKNAIDGIDTSLQLALTVEIIRPSENPQSCFSVINDIRIYKYYVKRIGEIILININQEVCSEIYEQLSRFDRDDKDIKGFTRLLARLEDTIRSGDSSALALRRALSYSYSYAGSSQEISPALRKELEDLAATQRTSEDFIKQAKDLLSRKKEKFDEIVAINERPFLHKISTFSGDGSSIPNYALNIIKRISQIKVLYLRERRKQIGKEEAELLLSLKMERGGTKILQNVQNIVFSLLGVSIDAFKRRGETDAEMDIDDFLADVNGSGVRESLRVVLDVLFEEPHILLIEEPEIHLHPSLETSMMSYLKQISNNIQIFITTHSTNFLDTSQMQNVYLVAKAKSTCVQMLNLEEAEIKIPQELGIRLSSLFMFDRLVFVEGHTDVSIIREWASTLNVNFSRTNVGFVTIEGARNISHYAAEGTLSFLKKRQVSIWFIIDRDERSNAEVAKIEAELGKKANIKVLKKREIENYLLSPQAIAKFVEQKRKMASINRDSSETEYPSENEIITTLNECAENLKQIAIDKRVARLLCKPIYPSLQWKLDGEYNTPIVQDINEEYDRIISVIESLKNSSQDVYNEQKELLEGIWEQRKLDLVPGDNLLDLICRKYSVRFKKGTDGPRLAALMSADEIDKEIKSIIEELGN